MNSYKSKKLIVDYLHSHNIRFTENLDNTVPRITMVFTGYDSCPGKIIESCIWFYEDDMEARIYYSELGAKICKESTHIEGLMRLFNFIHARVFPCTSDGMGGSLYAPHHLYTPSIYVTEDDCYDITLTTFINNDFFEVAPLETEDYITAACPELMGSLAPAIFGLLLGKINTDVAIEYVKKEILHEAN